MIVTVGATGNQGRFQTLNNPSESPDVSSQGCIKVPRSEITYVAKVSLFYIFIVSVCDPSLIDHNRTVSG